MIKNITKQIYRVKMRDMRYTLFGYRYTAKGIALSVYICMSSVYLFNVQTINIMPCCGLF